MGFLKKAIDFISHPTHSRTMGLLVMLVLVAAVSLTVIVAQQQQILRQRADFEACTNPTTTTCTPDGSCDNEGDTCKIGNTIYECSYGSVGGGSTVD